jgi:hypothetical protein
MGNSLLQELKASRESSSQENDKRVVDKIICGRITKKYRCGNFFRKEVNLNRNRLRKLSMVTAISRRRRNLQTYSALKEDVQAFFARDDISRCMPGKNDAIKVGGERKQVRILNDYLINLHEKFLMENRDKKISFSGFCKLRPKNIKTTSLLSRNTCLCTLHQNMALKLKSLKALGVEISMNPEVVKKTVTPDHLKQKLNALENSDKEFEHWKRVEIEGKKKMRIVKEVMPHDRFVEHMLNQYEIFLKHTERISAQYSAIYQLKDTLQVGHVIVQMDFAENFQCQTLDEIQSAYWNATSVTLHPVVAYYRRSENEALEHKNFVFVSDLNHHNSTAVLTILHKLMPLLKAQIPGMNTVHYWTDSPSSQYRNKYILNVIANHKQIFDVDAYWNYFETGHGKGPCDGIGGTCKRRAAEAVKQGKATIQDAHEFYNWAHKNEKGIAYYFYSQEEYESTAQSIDANIKAIPGTMKVHAVIAKGNHKILVRSTSCYCQKCVDHGAGMCSGWILHDLSSETDAQPCQNDGQEHTNEPDDNQVEEIVRFDVGDFVCAVYQNQWYIGEVINIDQTDKDAEICFLEKKKQFWQWPSREDKVWVNFHDIVCQVIKPVPTGKSQRMLKLAYGEKERIEKAFEEWKFKA